jgi:hypothetical protein
VDAEEINDAGNLSRIVAQPRTVTHPQASASASSGVAA